MLLSHTIHSGELERTLFVYGFTELDYLRYILRHQVAHARGSNFLDS